MDWDDAKIATMASHSALQILRGAKDEGFKSIAVCKKGATKPYVSFGVADQIIEIDDFSDFMSAEDELNKENAVVIPHGSFIAYMGYDNVKRIRVPYYGNKKILEWESKRDFERKWLSSAGLNLPLIFEEPADIDRSVIVKFYGASGGKGYFIANDENDFKAKIGENINREYQLQEYILGVPIYIHYFYSPLNDELEIMGCDKRYESNVDSLGRVSARDQMILKRIDPSYTIVGNIPIVMRESLLNEAFEMGEHVVEESKKLIGDGGLWGPFCLETVVTPDLDFYVFEISARIVAGTNPYTNGSPYTWLKYGEPMSTGRRIARDIKAAIETAETDKIIS